MMRNALKRLLDRLDAIGVEHEELFDSDVRQRMSNAVLDGFVRNRQKYNVPHDFGMFSTEANAAVMGAIAEFIVTAKRTADELQIKSFGCNPLAAFRDT